MTSINDPDKLLPWALADAKALGAKFGLRTIGGWRADGGGFTDHPDGRAIDLMVDDIPNGHAVGDAITAELIAHPDAYNVDYLIWDHRSWNPRRGTWAPYTDTADPHTTHVHLTVKKTAPTATIPTALTSAGGKVLDSLVNVDALMRQVEGTTITVVAALFGVALIGAGAILSIRRMKGTP